MRHTMFGRLHLAYATLLAMAAVEIAMAIVFGSRPVISYFRITTIYSASLLSLFPGLLWAAWIAILVVLRRFDRPSLAIWRMFRRNRGWIARGMLFAFLAVPLGRAVTVLKGAIPSLNPFYADPYFINLDRAIFGTDPWRITHRWIGEYGTLFIDRMYALWFLLMMIFIGWGAFTRNQNIQLRILISLFVTWIVLGNLLATLLSSVGPCFVEIFYGDRYYAGLMATINGYDENLHLKASMAMRYLIKVYGADQIGAGISAMPSIHIAVAFLFFLACRFRFGRRWQTWAAGTYAVIIAVGSVHLGWHYAVDGLVSMAFVTLIWWATGKFIDWVGTRETVERVSGEPANPAAPLTV